MASLPLYSITQIMSGRTLVVHRRIRIMHAARRNLQPSLYRPHAPRNHGAPLHRDGQLPRYYALIVFSEGNFPKPSLGSVGTAHEAIARIRPSGNAGAPQPRSFDGRLNDGPCRSAPGAAAN